MRSTLELLADLFSEVRQLSAWSFRWSAPRLASALQGFPSSLAALILGVVLLPVTLGLILVAAALFVARFGPPTDAAFLIVALVAILASVLLLRVGASRLKPSRLVPAKSRAQISSLIWGLSGGHEYFVEQL
jgi:hypothetical protein